MVRFILYSRSYCHLCDDMRAAFVNLGLNIPYALEIRDVDIDPLLLERYDERVPVLAGRRQDGAEQELCQYFFDADAVRQFVDSLQ